MATGDKKNAMKKLQAATKTIKYTTIDFNEYKTFNNEKFSFN